MELNISHEQDGVRKWFIGALVASVAIHLGLAGWAHFKKLERFGDGQQERLVPRPFHVKQAYVDPKAFEPEADPPKQFHETKPHIPIPDEKPDIANLPEKVKLTPNAPEPQAIIPEKPAPMGGKLPKMTEPGLNPAVRQDLDNIRQQLAHDHAPRVPPSSLHPTGEGASGPVTGTEGATNPGFSNLDDLLNRAGPLTGSVAPVAMPGGALFEYDQAELRDQALASLRKIGQLIQQNPRATFSIEGHTDSFGNADYNQSLSEARASAVKAWLVNEMGISPAQIETRGFGSKRLIAPETGTPEEQAVNRRVEIVIRPPQP